MVRVMGKNGAFSIYIINIYIIKNEIYMLTYTVVARGVADIYLVYIFHEELM